MKTYLFSNTKNHFSKIFILFAMLLSVGVWGQGLEDFSGIASSTSYGTRTWTGTNGTSWTATDAREDQAITSKAITIRNGSLTFGLTNAQKSSGIGDLTLKAKAPFGSPDIGSLQLIVNGTVVSAKSTTGAATTTVVTYTWTAINVGTITSIEIKQNTSGSRITIDDISWTGYAASANPSLAITGTTAHGTVCPGIAAAPQTYTITNTGTAAAGVTVVSNDSQFVVSDLSSTSIAASGGTATYKVTFTPSSAGSKTATVTVSSTTAGSNSPTSSLTGTGATPVTPVAVTAAATVITASTATLNATSGTTFGVCPATIEKGFVYSSVNTSPTDVDTKVTVTLGTTQTAYNYNASTLAPGTTYYYRAYLYNGSTYTFGGAQNFTTASATPEINIKQGATNISSAGSYAFGNQISSTSSSAITFTVENTGTANLLLSGSPKIVISGTNASEFTINETATAATVGAAGTTTFTISFSPVSLGAKTAQISIANNDSDENPYIINFTGTGTASALSKIIVKSGYTYPQNILYANYQAADITGGSGDIEIAKFTIVDGDGSTNDTDNLATTLSQLTLSLTNSTNIRSIAIYDGATEIAEKVASATVNFTGLVLQAPDNGTKDFSIRVSFNTTATDNQSVRLTVAATTSAATTGSTFAATNAGGALTSVAGDDNKIEVVADRLAFVAQPSNTNTSTNMPAVTVSANDVNGVRDLDFVSSVAITSTGTLSSSPVSTTSSSGLATYSTLQHTVAGTGLTLNAASAGLTSATSSAFNIILATNAADYFRSNVSSGTWATAASWQSSNDNANWITATAEPTSAANTITIRAGHNITLSSTVTLDQLVIANGGQLTVDSTTGTLNINDGTGVDIDVRNGGVFQVLNTAGTFAYSGTIVFTGSASMNIAGKIMVGDGMSGAVGSGYGEFGFAAASQIIWNDGAILEWNTTGSTPGVSGNVYFPGASSSVIPVFRITKISGGSLSGGSATVVNGLFQLNGANVIWAGNGTRTFRNGIVATGTSTMSISGGTGKWQIGDDAVSGNAEIGGSTGVLTLSNTNGTSISSVCSAKLTSNVILSSGTFTNNGMLNLEVYALSGVAPFTSSLGSSLITNNTGGLVSAIAVSGAKTFAAGTNYTFNANTTTPFPTGTIGNPANLTFNNANVISNKSGSNIIVSGAVNVNGTSVFALNPVNNNLNLGGVMIVGENATFDNNGENQITDGGGSIIINGTFITRDAQGFTGTNTSIPSIAPTLGNNSTIVYALSGDQAVTNFTYRNLTFSGSGIKTTGTISSITGNVTINTGVTVDSGTRSFGGAGTNLIMLGTSIFKTGGSSTKPDIGGDYTLANTSTIEFGGASDTNIRANPSYGNINVTGSNVNLSGPGTSLTLQSGSAFTVKSGGTFNVKNINGLSGAASTAINNVNNPSVLLETGSTINYDGDTQVVTNSHNYSNLIISTPGVKTASGVLAVAQNLNIDAGTLALKASTGNDINLGGVMTIASDATFDNNGENQVINANNASIVNNGTFITRDAQGFSGVNAVIPTITNVTIGAGSTVHYAFAGNQIVSTRSDYQNLLFTGNGTKTVSGNTTPIAGTVTINDANTVVDASDKILGSNATNLTMTAGTLRVAGTGLKPDFGGTYNLAAGTTVDFYGSAVAQIRLTPAYANVVISGTDVTTDLSQSLAGVNFIPGGHFTVKNGAEFDVHNVSGFSGSNTTAVPLASTAITLEAASTIDYNGADQTVTNAMDYPNLKVSSMGIKSPTANLTVSGLTTVNAGTLKILETADGAMPNVFYAHKGIVNTAGAVVLETNANLMQDAAGVTNSGNIQALRKAKVPKMGYTYWSSPVIGQNLYTFSDGGTTNGTPKDRFWQYDEETDKFKNTGTFLLGDTSVFEPGKAYAVRGQNQFNATTPTSHEFAFIGTPNNGNVSFISLKHTANAANSKGYNLVGNPYPSDIDFDALYDFNKTKIYGTMYFWTNNDMTVTSQQGSGYSGNNYAMYNLMGGVSAVDPAPNQPGNPVVNPTPTNIIKIGQGFIIKSKAGSNNQQLNFTNAMRVANSGAFFNNKSNTEKDRFWLKLTTPANIANTILVGYTAAATNDFEIDYDGELFIVGSDSFYSLLGSKKLAIQGRSTFNTEDKVGLGNVYSQNGNYKISLKNAEGVFNGGQNIYLKDRLLNKTVNLTNGDYIFQAVKGTDLTRFEIVYKGDLVLGTDQTKKDDFVVYKDGSAYVVSSSKSLGNVEVYDAIGRLLISQKTANKTIKLDASSLSNGIYVIKAENSGYVRTKKVLK